jgi:Fic family protein
MGDRETRSADPEFVEDKDARAALEAENALLQFDQVLDLVDEVVRDGRKFRLRPSTILALQGTAMRGVHPQAGTFRNTPVEISGSKHQPPHESLVAAKVEDLCDWVNDNWSRRSAVDLCAYIMWRLNWIHPFADGNGRTTRAVAYLVLCVRSNARLPGSPTIPEQIAEDKTPYYDALEALDKAEVEGETELEPMIDLLQKYLERQLGAALEAATSANDRNDNPKKLH